MPSGPSHPLAPPSISDNQLSDQFSPVHGNTTPFNLSRNLSAAAPLGDSQSSRDIQASDDQPTQQPATSDMLAAISTSQGPIFRGTTHRSTQSVPHSPSSPSFRHSAVASVSRLPLTPESPAPRHKYGVRLSETPHDSTSPLLSKADTVNTPLIHQSSSTLSRRKSEEELLGQKQGEPFPIISSTFPLSSPPISPSPPPRKTRPSLEGIFDTPSPKPRNSGFSTTSMELDAQVNSVSRVRDRPLPRGENPFIFGKSSPRRMSRAGSPQLLVLDSKVLSEPPSLSVTSPTPRPSPSKTSSSFPNDPTTLPSMAAPGILRPPETETTHSQLKTVTYEDELLGGGSLSSQSKKKGGSDEDGKLETLSLEEGQGSRRTSNTSPTPPSAFNATRRNSKSTKTPHVALAPPAPSSNVASEADSAKSNVTPERPRTTTPRPLSRTASSRARFLENNSSRASFPISAIVNPRPPSVIRQPYDFVRRDEGLYMRDPYREPKHVSWRVRLRGKNVGELDEKEAGSVHARNLQSPTTGLLFYLGFLLPPLWWIGSFLRGFQFDPLVASEQRWNPWRVQLAREQDHYATAWRDRCRFMALVSLVTYLPLIVLLAIFIPK